jgi:cell shape-determining protein MreD
MIKVSEPYDSIAIIQFVNKRLETKVRLVFGPDYSKYYKYGVLTLLLCLVIYVIRNFKTVVNNRNLWFAFAIVIFIICTGGMANHLIKESPWFLYDRNEKGEVVIR